MQYPVLYIITWNYYTLPFVPLYTKCVLKVIFSLWNTELEEILIYKKNIALSIPKSSSVQQELWEEQWWQHLPLLHWSCCGPSCSWHRNTSAVFHEAKHQWQPLMVASTLWRGWAWCTTMRRTRQPRVQRKPARGARWQAIASPLTLWFLLSLLHQHQHLHHLLHHCLLQNPFLVIYLSRIVQVCNKCFLHPRSDPNTHAHNWQDGTIQHLLLFVWENVRFAAVQTEGGASSNYKYVLTYTTSPTQTTTTVLDPTFYGPFYSSHPSNIILTFQRGFYKWKCIGADVQISIHKCLLLILNLFDPKNSWFGIYEATVVEGTPTTNFLFSQFSPHSIVYAGCKLSRLTL